MQSMDVNRPTIPSEIVEALSSGTKSITPDELSIDYSRLVMERIDHFVHLAGDF